MTLPVPEPSPAAALTQMIFGKWVSMAISVAAKLRIADHLADRSQTAEELAAQTGADPRSLFRLLRALASVGVFASNPQGQFRLTPLGELLRTGVPGSLRGVADYCGADWSWRAWERLMHSVQTGETAFDHVFGERVFEYLAKRPEESAVFNEGMTGFSGIASEAVTLAYDFSPFRKLADIGGGHGFLLATVLAKYPTLQGILFDSPHVVAGAGSLLQEFQVADRCQIVGGDFFSQVPSGCDAYLLKHIIHDWNDADATRILRVIHAAAHPGTRLLLVEMVIPPGDTPHPGKLLDLEMLVVASGQERTESEFRELLKAAGFRLLGVTATRSPASIVEAVAE